MAKILIVEDDVTFCSVIKDALSFQNYTVEAVHNGKAALQLLEGFTLRSNYS